MYQRLIPRFAEVEPNIYIRISSKILIIDEFYIRKPKCKIKMQERAANKKQRENVKSTKKSHKLDSTSRRSRERTTYNSRETELWQIIENRKRGKRADEKKKHEKNCSHRLIYYIGTEELECEWKRQRIRRMGMGRIADHIETVLY